MADQYGIDIFHY